MLAVPQGYISSLCEIKTLTNDLLATGSIIKIDVDALEIAGTNNERMPLMQYKMPVKIFIHNSRLSTMVMAGVVYLSTENFVRVEEIKPLADFERRSAFRVNTNVEGKLQKLLTGAEQREFDNRIAAMAPDEAEAALQASFIEVRVMDLSLTGVRVLSPVVLRSGEKYYLEFKPIDRVMTFCVNVQRIIKMANDTVQYGCQFFDFSERQLDFLCKDLFQLQRLEKNRRRNAPV